MKNLRTLLILAFAAVFASCSTKVAEKPENQIFRLDGIEPAVNYSAPTPITEGYDGELAVIMVHGWHGGVQILEAQSVIQESVGEAYVLAPMFPRTEIMKMFEVEMDGRAIWNESWPLDLTKPGVPDDDWRGGGDANGTELSSYDIIDIFLAKLSDKTLFPNLKRIALVGFSAGGQFVGRYVAVGKGEVREGIEMRYVAMAPSTYLLPNPNDTWHYGLDNRPRYSRNISEEQIMENLRSRRCMHACGSNDTNEENLDMTASAMAQGCNRYVRFENFQKVVNSDARWSEMVTFHTFEGISHESLKAYKDPFFVNYVKGN